MKKFLLLLAILATMNSDGQSRNTDSTTVSNVALRRILTAAEQKKVLDEQVLLLNQRIAGYESMVQQYKDKDTATVGSYEREIALMKDERKIFESAIKDKEKQIRKYKRKLFFRTAGGVLVTGGLVYLYLTK